jgi:ligand-binding SRPBCC domain-containing protein
MPYILLTTRIYAPIEKCFDLSRNIDFHQESTSRTKEKAVGGVTSGLIGFGEEVEWRARHFGVYMNLRTRITEFNYPFSFTDEMTKGPFRKMKHRHIFTKHKNFTEMKDEFYFEAPFGLLGKLISELILRPYLQRLLATRNNFIKTLAEKKNI